MKMLSLRSHGMVTMTEIKVSEETLSSLADLNVKYEKQGMHYADFSQIIQDLVDEKLKELNLK